jgi:multiple sugar transport system substrate-binding protein
MSRARASRITALLTVAAAGLATGCAGQGPAAPGTGPWPSPQATQQATGTGTGTVTILSGTDTSESSRAGEPGMYAELIDWWNTYERPVTHISIALDTVTGGATAEHSEMLADAGTGNASDTGNAAAVIYNLDNEWVPEFAAAGFIWSLQGHLSPAGFLGPPLQSGVYDGQLYAAPFTTDVGLLYYLNNRGVSVGQLGHQTFTDLVTLAGKARAPGGGPAIGYAGQFAGYEGLTVNLLEIIHSYDPNAFAPNGTIRDSYAVTQGLQQLYDAMHETGVIPASELGFQEAQSFSAFAAGKVLFMRNWPIYYNQLVAAGDKGSSKTAQDLGVAPLPFPSVLGGQDLAISRNSANPSAALQVIKYLTSPQAEECLFAVGGFPATRGSAYTGAPLPQGYGAITGHPLCGSTPGPSLAIASKILAGIRNAFNRPRTPYYTEFSTIIQNLVPQMLHGASPDDLPTLVKTLEASLNAAASGHAPPTGAAPGAP